MRLLELGWTSPGNPRCQERVWVLFIASLPFYHLYQIHCNKDVIISTSNKILKGGHCFYLDQLVEMQSEAFMLGKEFWRESSGFKIGPTFEYSNGKKTIFNIWQTNSLHTAGVNLLYGLMEISITEEVTLVKPLGIAHFLRKKTSLYKILKFGASNK